MRFAPGAAPWHPDEGVRELLRIVWEQFQDIALDMTQLQLREIHVAPVNPQNGFIYYADGTDWNPGSGKGVYLYNGSSYQFLG